ncbi:hypothetical protein L6452_37147 [Arctium lappa]|uniref:Uncharacterized protein n=1 Tax=Arctium lappa TaxID=4217 RepID=A0ACB8Y288_ARCLA|nr:hypothetical protein L6452_37147 [Arctium lappa]
MTSGIRQEGCLVHSRHHWDDGAQCVETLVELLAPLSLCLHVAKRSGEAYASRSMKQGSAPFLFVVSIARRR